MTNFKMITLGLGCFLCSVAIGQESKTTEVAPKTATGSTEVQKVTPASPEKEPIQLEKTTVKAKQVQMAPVQKMKVEPKSNEQIAPERKLVAEPQKK